MRLHVKPIYGWGWYDDEAKHSIEVPAQFELDVEIIQAGTPFQAVQGQCRMHGHPLSGLWILLSQRHVEYDGHFNLLAFRQSNPNPATDKTAYSGFAEAKIISD